MSVNLTNSAITQFDSEVKHAYQKAGLLRPSVTTRMNVTGSTYKFAAMGKGLATERTVSSADVTPMDITHSRPTATLSNWDASEYTDLWDAAEVNFDERQELAETIAGALGRREDQLIIDALDAATSTAGTIAVGGPLTLATLTSASEALNDLGVPMGDRCMATSARGIKNLLDDTEVGSADYNSVRVLMSGEINTFMGFTFKMVETRAEGGLPLATSTRTSFAYHKSAVGLAVGIDLQTRVDWVAHKKSWLATGSHKAGAVVRDPDGFVDITHSEA